MGITSLRSVIPCARREALAKWQKAIPTFGGIFYSAEVAL